MGTGLRRRNADPHGTGTTPIARRLPLVAVGLAAVLAPLAALPGATPVPSRDAPPSTAGHVTAASAPAEATSHALPAHAGHPDMAAHPSGTLGTPGASGASPVAHDHVSQAAASVVPHAEVHMQPASGAGDGHGEHAGAAAASVGTAAMPEPNVAAVRYGPIPALPSILGAPMSTTAGVPLLANLPLIPAPCSNCFATGTTIDLVYDNGQPANLDTGVMLHHLVLFQPQVDDATCARATPVGLLGQRFFASGNERTAGNLPDGYGIHLGGGPLAAYFEIMNHSSELKLVYITATVRWLPDSTPGIKAVTPVWFDENNCSTSTYAIPAGPSSRTRSWTSTLTGRFVTAGGHVHDGGVRTMLMNDKTGQHICSSVAGYGTKPAYMGSIESMSLCSWDRLGTVRKGEVLSLTTDYVSSQAQSDVMGIMLAYLYPTDDLNGGTPAPASVNDPSSMTPPPVMHEHGG